MTGKWYDSARANSNRIQFEVFLSRNIFDVSLVSLLMHLDRKSAPKTSKPFTCEKCFRSFGSKADLRRHTREIHQERGVLESNNRCPEVSCERHRKGFARHWNLRDHIRRRHRDEFKEVINTSNIIQERMNLDAAETSDESESSGGSPEPQTDIGLITAQTELEKTPNDIRQHIQGAISALRAQRKEIDSQIDNYEHQLDWLDHQEVKCA
jgi:Zinc finger, C2H2 type